MFDPQAIIAEANLEATKATETAPVQETQATSEEAHVTETSEANNQETDDIAKKPDSELTPEQLAKREANRQSHLNRKLAKQRLREENRELKTRLEKLEQSLQQKPTNQPNIPSDYPKEEDYENVLDYFKAVAKYEAKQELSALRESATPKQADTSKVQRLQEMANLEAQFAKNVPDYERVVYQENAYIMNNMPKHVAEALLDAEDASLALYTLAKEGRLEDLEDLEGKALDKAIAKAEERGKAYLSPAKRTSSAPPPIESLKGTGRAAKSDYDLSIPELMKKYNR